MEDTRFNIGQEMLTLSGTPDLIPMRVHIHFLPWVRSANFGLFYMDADFGLFAWLSLTLWS